MWGRGRRKDGRVESCARCLRLVVDLQPPRFIEGFRLPPEVASYCVNLNANQQEALQRVLAAEDYALLLGMPGTGKTTVIAAAVQNLVRTPGRTIWLVAQSNVAIKNVAEKLADIGFWDFRILVSKELLSD